MMPRITSANRSTVVCCAPAVGPFCRKGPLSLREVFAGAEVPLGKRDLLRRRGFTLVERCAPAVGPFCRKGPLSLREVFAGAEVPLGKRDLLRRRGFTLVERCAPAVGPFCRKGPLTLREVFASAEVPLGKRDLLRRRGFTLVERCAPAVGPFCRKGPLSLREVFAGAEVPLGKRDLLRRRGFTLVELLVTISIISILVSIVLFAMAAAQEIAKEDRTRAQIARIDALLADKWETYTTRRLDVNVKPIPGYSPRQNATVARVDGVRELMRMELPDRKSDLGIPDPGIGAVEKSGLPTVLRNPPYLYRAYRRKALKLLTQHHGRGDLNSLGPKWTSDHQGGECLYLILSQMSEDDTSALRFFNDNEIADVDNDGMPEIVDAWGTPIGFLRWAPGFFELPTPSMPEGSPRGIQDREAPDAFDPTGVYADTRTFALYPLVFSAGPDKLKEIYLAKPMIYSAILPRNNPYFGVHGYANGYTPAGEPYDANNDDQDNSRDNIHNHLLVAGT